MRKTKKKGQAIVEMSILFPVFLLVIVGGIIDFGFAFYNVLALEQIANDAAQRASEQGLSESQIRSFISSYPTPPVGWSHPGIYNAEITNVNLSDGSRMKRISLEYNSKTYTPFYQTVVNSVTGHDYMVLRTQATYKIPNNVLRN